MSISTCLFMSMHICCRLQADACLAVSLPVYAPFFEIILSIILPHRAFYDADYPKFIRNVP